MAAGLSPLEILTAEESSPSDHDITVEGIRIINKTPGVEYIILPSQERALKHLKDGLLRKALTEAGHKEDFFEDPRFVLYLNVFGRRKRPKGVRHQRGSYEQSYEQIKEAYHLEDKKRMAFAFYLENSEVLERAERQFQIPRQHIAGLIGIETSFGTYLGEYDFFNAGVSNYLRMNKEGFFKRDWSRKQLLLGMPELKKIGLAPLDTRSSYATAVGPAQFIFTTYAEGHFVSSDPNRQPNVFHMHDSIFSAANLLSNYGWRGLSGEVKKDSPAWRALQRYNGCIGHPAGDYRRDHYPNLVVELGDHLQAQIKTAQDMTRTLNHSKI